MIGIFTGKQIASYMGLPQFKVRLEEIFTGGFQYIAYFMALVYSAVNLLPAQHPYTRADNIGKFGIRHVIAEAANNLVLKKENADQIILFIALLIGLILIFMQICVLGAAMFMQPVFASMPTNFAGFFLTPTATESTDIAHIMMDLVFGVSDGSNHMFNSCVAQGITCTETLADTGYGPPSPATRDVMVDSSGNSIYQPLGFPFPIHTAMHQMFQLYNTGLLVVAVIIASYFMVTIVVETAQTGTPFGKRFNKVWAPIRIVFAIGMLVPVGLGFNGSQYAVLYAAKFGSGFATNSWNYFNATITNGYFGDMKDLVSTPNVPEMQALLQFFYVARTCAYLEKFSSSNTKEIKMYAVRGTDSGSGTKRLEIQDLGTDNATVYQDILDFTDNSTSIKFVFGIEDDIDFGRFEGNIYPSCGAVTMKLTDARSPNAAENTDKPELGTAIMQQYYLYVLRELWHNTYTVGLLGGGNNYPENLVKHDSPWNVDRNALLPDAAFRSRVIDYYRKDLESAMVSCATASCAVLGITEGAIPTLQDSDRYNVNNLVTEKGWAGAAIWYNRIAEMNGAVTSAVLNVPFPSAYPDVMEQVLAEKKKRNNNVVMETRFHPQVLNGEPLQLDTEDDYEKANILWEAYKYLQTGDGGSSPHVAPTGNAMIDSINALFGTEGLYNIRRNPDTHPLAQIVGIGRSLVEAAIRNLTISVVAGVSGNLLGTLVGVDTGLIKVFSAFLITVTMVSLTAGFILFYVVPFLPFIYFFFAVGGWLKGIIEAMVGAPLWALAHIRIDQNGLPGQAGVAGYFLIFEIFLRPILMLFGMLASISIFSALVSVLNQVFDLVTTNVGGFDYRAETVGSVETPRGAETVTSTLGYARSAIDEFFFTIIYTIIIYLMGMSSFKLIDLIPNNILRWMGQSTATFNDQREDAAQGLVGKATVGSQQTSGALGSGLQKLVQ